MHDGNFSQSHLFDQYPEDDVHLTDGELFMVARQRYKEHIDTAIEIKDVSSLSFSP